MKYKMALSYRPAMTNQNYANQILHNRSFKGLDLTGADFRGSDLRGCDFTGSILVGANFEGVRTGQSQRQVKTAIAAAMVGPAIIIGLCLSVVQIPISIFGDRFYQGFDFLLKGLPLLVLFLEVFFRDRIVRQFPRTTNLMGVVSVAALFQIMVVLTIGLFVAGLSGNGAGIPGFFLLLASGISGVVTYRIFQWVRQSIRSSCGTSFRKANLTDANLSHAVIQNTDFCFAVLTAACIYQWRVKRHTDFFQVYCEYLYLEPAHQNRHPADGKFRPGEVEPFFIEIEEQNHIQDLGGF